MRSLMNFFGGLRIRVLNPLMAGVLFFAVVVGMVGQVDAQTSRYTLDDVMDKLDDMVDKMIEMDKRLGVVETEVKRNRELIETVNTNLGDRISATNTTMRWLFGLLGALFAGILVFVFSIARNMAPAESSKAFRKEVREIAERERVLEGKLEDADRSVPKILEALRQEVSALAERQKELEGKLKLAEVI